MQIQEFLVCVIQIFSANNSNNLYNYHPTSALIYQFILFLYCLRYLSLKSKMGIILL